MPSSAARPRASILPECLLGLAAAVVCVVGLQGRITHAGQPVAAPLALAFATAAGANNASYLRLFPPAVPNGAAPSAARSLLEGTACLFALPDSAAAAAAASWLPQGDLPSPRFWPVPAALRASARVRLELALVQGAKRPAVCVTLRDARGRAITSGVAPFSASGHAACGADRLGRALALDQAAVEFSHSPGATLAVELLSSSVDAPTAGELRLTVFAGGAGSLPGLVLV